MQTPLTVLMTWISVNVGLPASDEHPRVEFATPAQMAAVRQTRQASARPEDAAVRADLAAPTELGHEVQAIYDDLSRTIYLPEGWTGTAPAETSVLVHELVHHLQNLGGLKYECPAAREKPAYEAQARWLELFGKNLVDEFQLDAMTVLVRTSCMR